MTTELHLIHTIWDIIRAGLTNQDDPINERLMRAFLSIHRGRTISTAYGKGALIDEECFQNLGTLSFDLTGQEYVNTTLPKIVRFRNNYGFMFNKDGYRIPIVDSEEFQNAPKDRFNKYQPKLKLIGRKLVLYVGKEQDSTQIESMYNSEMNITVRKLKEEARMNALTISGLGVLVNPDDDPGYDWTTTPYPMPDELIEDLINSVNAREFNIFLKMRTDETGDIRSNTAEYNTREEL